MNDIVNTEAGELQDTVAAALAWQDAEADVIISRHRGERWRWIGACALVWLALLAVAVACTLAYTTDNVNPAPAQTPAPSANEQYLSALKAKQLSPAPERVDNALGNAYQTCADLGRGYTSGQIAQRIYDANPGMSITIARFTVDTAIKVYCPQYGGR